MCWERRDDGNRYDGRELGTTTTTSSYYTSARRRTDKYSSRRAIYILGAREKGAAKEIGLSRGRQERPPGSRVEGAKNIS